MQSINAGFQSLRTLLPHHEGEKLSKAAILQQTAEYIYTLEQEKTRLLSQNSQLKRLLSLSQQRLEGLAEVDTTSPRLKKKRGMTETSGDSGGSFREEEQQLYQTSTDVNMQLIQEQRLRQRLEERLKTLENQMGSSNTTNSSSQQVNNPPPPPQLPTHPIKMEAAPAVVINHPEDHSGSIAQRGVVVQPSTTVVPSVVPGTILLADKDGVRVEVEPIPTLPTQPRPPQQTNQPPQPTPQPLPQAAANVEEASQELTAAPSTSGKPGARSYIVTSTSRQNLDSIVEAIRHLEGDHLFSEDPQQVAKEEVVEYSAPPATEKQLVTAAQVVPSKVVTVGDLSKAPLATTTTAIPQKLLPQQPHPPSVLQQHQKKDSSNSIIIVKHCQT